MKSYVMGIDFGSTTAKTVILDLKGQIVASCVAHMGAVSGEGVKASISGALEQAGLTQSDMGRTVSTGYGRRMLDEADKNYTEITCHARGASAMVPDARLVIDIGGQDSKVIALDGTGLVMQFAMNDRCAAGTGKFLEVLARAMEIGLEHMGDVAMQAKEDLKISSMCATFAETEVISLLAEGQSKPDVLGAVHAAIANRTVGLVGRVGKRGPVVMTGGVAKNKAAVHYIQKALDMPIILPATPQIAGALGAALIGLDDYRTEHREALALLDDDPLEEQMNSERSCAPGCKGVPQEMPAQPVAFKSKTQNLWNKIQQHL
jgi:(R)-2-hydroxyacyl-CoA dehydratese activating ATPase